MTLRGLLIGRQMRSPAPVQMASPSESWISGRQSTPCTRSFSLYQNIDVSGATPSRWIALRGCSSHSTSITTPFVRAQSKRNAPVTLGPSSMA